MTKKIRDLEIGDIIYNSQGNWAEIIDIGEEGSIRTIDMFGNTDVQEFEELQEEEVEVFTEEV